MFILCNAVINTDKLTTLGTGSFNAGFEKVLTGAAGNYQAEFVGGMRQVPRIQFDVRKIDALAAPVLTTAALIFRSVDQGGTGNSTYLSLTGSTGACLCVPRTLSWSPGGPASLSVEIIFLSTNGTTAPITVGSTAGDLTAETAQWVGGGTGVQQISLDFGYAIQIPPDGNLYAVDSYVMAQRPRLSIITRDPTLATTANLNPGSVASLTATLNTIATGGVRGAAKTFTLTGHKIVEQLAAGAPGTLLIACDGVGGITIA